ncbi:DUF6714 family protein [Prosthecobacter fusiformis]|uniref:DUF6714 family protein n=1 Tax=Prosthecobacter fusiformis TaxID=48464 RepID=UPI00105B6050|nr:DUF6714 family protein [Prosthecobacter fusiformis]
MTSPSPDKAARAEAAALIQEIEKAFADIPRPRITRSVATGYDAEWQLSDERISELASQDAEQHWTDVTDESMQHCQEYFFFSDAEGWRFYLPAYMCHYLRGFPNFGWDAAWGACAEATHIDLLTESQLRCIDQFLSLCKKYES